MEHLCFIFLLVCTCFWIIGRGTGDVRRRDIIEMCIVCFSTAMCIWIWQVKRLFSLHQSYAIGSAMASQITGVSIVYPTVCSGKDHQRKHQSSMSLTFVMEFTRLPVISSHKTTITRKRFPFDDVIMKTKFWMECATQQPFLGILSRYPACIQVTGTHLKEVLS